MNEYHLIASNDHFTKREKNIDINKLKASLNTVDYKDFTTDLTYEAHQVTLNQPGLYIFDTENDDNVIVSSRDVFSVDITDSEPIAKIKRFTYSAGVYISYMMNYAGYMLTLTNKGMMHVYYDWQLVADIDIQYWWMYKSKPNYVNGSRLKSLPVHAGKYLYAVCGTDSMDLYRIDLDRLCNDAASSSLGDPNTYKIMMKANVQANCLDTTKKYFYVIDELTNYERKFDLSGKQISISRGYEAGCNRWCLSSSRYFLVCSMSTNSVRNSKMTLTLYSPSLKKLHSACLTSTDLLTYKATMLVDIHKSKHSILIAFNTKYRMTCYSLLRDRLYLLVHEHAIGIDHSTAKFDDMIDTISSSKPKCTVFHMMRYRPDKSDRLVILISGFTRGNSNMPVYGMYLAKLTINV